MKNASMQHHKKQEEQNTCAGNSLELTHEQACRGLHPDVASTDMYSSATHLDVALQGDARCGHEVSLEITCVSQKNVLQEQVRCLCTCLCKKQARREEEADSSKNAAQEKVGVVTRLQRHWLDKRRGVLEKEEEEGREKVENEQKKSLREQESQGSVVDGQDEAMENVVCTKMRHIVPRSLDKFQMLCFQTLSCSIYTQASFYMCEVSKPLHINQSQLTKKHVHELLLTNTHCIISPSSHARCRYNFVKHRVFHKQGLPSGSSVLGPIFDR